MTPEETLFHHVATNVEFAVAAKLFGKPCYNINGKAFCCFFENEMVFKLDGDFHSDALSLDGTQLFDPSKKGRAMKEWVQVPADYQAVWQKLANAAARYVGRL